LPPGEPSGQGTALGPERKPAEFADPQCLLKGTDGRARRAGIHTARVHDRVGDNEPLPETRQPAPAVSLTRGIPTRCIGIADNVLSGGLPQPSRRPRAVPRRAGVSSERSKRERCATARSRDRCPSGGWEARGWRARRRNRPPRRTGSALRHTDSHPTTALRTLSHARYRQPALRRRHGAGRSR